MKEPSIKIIDNFGSPDKSKNIKLMLISDIISMKSLIVAQDER